MLGCKGLKPFHSLDLDNGRAFPHCLSFMKCMDVVRRNSCLVTPWCERVNHLCSWELIVD